MYQIHINIRYDFLWSKQYNNGNVFLVTGSIQVLKLEESLKIGSGCADSNRGQRAQKYVLRWEKNKEDGSTEENTHSIKFYKAFTLTLYWFCTCKLFMHKGKSQCGIRFPSGILAHWQQVCDLYKVMWNVKKQLKRGSGVIRYSSSTSWYPKV